MYLDNVNIDVCILDNENIDVCILDNVNIVVCICKHGFQPSYILLQDKSWPAKTFNYNICNYFNETSTLQSAVYKNPPLLPPPV